jgi:inner membrane protein
VDLIPFLKTSVTGKILVIGALILALLIPLGMIENLIAERARLYESAREEIAGTWGRGQTIGGPILIVPFRFKKDQHLTATDELYLLPDELEIASEAHVHELARGIYRVPVYDAQLRIGGRFTVPDLGAQYDSLELFWNQAQIALPISDTRSIREPVRFTTDGASAVFEPGGTRVAGFGNQLVAKYADLNRAVPTAPFEFSLDVAIGGSGWIGFLPLGAVTRVKATADWPSPSFRGAYLPEQRNVTTDGFDASWRVLDVGRGFPSQWTRSNPLGPVSGEATAFGAVLIKPVGVHEASVRSVKYGVLLIGLTFAAYFLFELFATVRLHALQYLLIGMANCVFYLLLLALAEHVGFGIAYLASAVASTALIASYSAAALHSMRRALPIGALLGALYSYLYVTLRAEDYALLLGALGSFCMLASIMYLTRHVDWCAARFAALGSSGGQATQRSSS